MVHTRNYCAGLDEQSSSRIQNCKATSESSCISVEFQYRSWIGICFQFVLHKLCILQNLPKTYLISTRLPKRKNKSGRRTEQAAEMVKILKILYGIGSECSILLTAMSIFRILRAKIPPFKTRLHDSFSSVFN